MVYLRFNVVLNSFLSTIRTVHSGAIFLCQVRKILGMINVRVGDKHITRLTTLNLASIKSNVQLRNIEERLVCRSRVAFTRLDK